MSAHRGAAPAESSSCSGFLQWALPRLSLSWSGFRRVRRQVCRRVAERLRELGLGDCGAYRGYLEAHPEEWTRLDSLCRISISRWWRDEAVFECLGQVVLPELGRAALARGGADLRCWCAGAASGEEPYSLRLLWAFEVQPRFPDLSLDIVATDVDPALLARAALARYRPSSVRHLPRAWLDVAFDRDGDAYVLQPQWRDGVRLLRQDLRRATPEVDAPFDLILCRNLAFTYFDDRLQRNTLERLVRVLRPGGGLVIGLNERLPPDPPGVEPWVAELGIYRKARDRAWS